MPFKPVQSVQRALTLLEAIARRQEGVSLKELAVGVGCSSAATYHLVQTLVDAGYVRRLETPPRYVLGDRLMLLAGNQKQDRFFDVVYDEMLRLHRRLPQASIYFAQQVAGNVVIRSQLLAHLPGQIQHEVNATLPPYVSAASVVHLAFWSAERRDQYMSLYDYATYGRVFWGAWKAFERVLERTRKDRCIFVPDGEPTRLKLGVPVFNAGGTLAGSFTIQWNQTPKSALAGKRKLLQTIGLKTMERIANRLAEADR